jgi:hypothetical protein
MNDHNLSTILNIHRSAHGRAPEAPAGEDGSNMSKA